jgi:hypothetical protein
VKISLVGTSLIASLVIAVSAVRTSSQPAANSTIDAPLRAPSAELIMHVTEQEGLPQVVTVLDPRQRVLAIYHVDRTSGQILPRSVRNITWDLQMIEFNSGKPLPQDVRSGLQQ